MDETPLIIPSSFLPHLPRSQTSFAPFLPADVLAHIAILKELYVPPVHGGFTVSEYHDNNHDDDGGRGKGSRGKKGSKERRFSVGLAETMDGLGLDLDSEAASTSKLPEVQEVSSDSDGIEIGDEDENEGEGEGDEDEAKPHLDPFEREWAEKWLSGVVRRAQGCIEEHEDNTEVARVVKEAEVILRDATACLAMMAGTSGEHPRPECCRTHQGALVGLSADEYSCWITNPSSLVPDTLIARAWVTGFTACPTR